MRNTAKIILTTIPAKTIMSNNFESLFMDSPVFSLLHEEFSITYGYLRVKKLTQMNPSFLF
jgi:hypothetical protein